MTTASPSTLTVAHPHPHPHPLILRRVFAVVAGALLVAVGAQVAVPLPGTPVPITFQVPAVLLVGGLLGPRLGAASLVLYLAMGIGGLPVFAPTGPPGLARLVGPTGGYLLAMPLAAGLTGLLAAGGRSLGTVALGVVAGVVVIHLGGVAQLGALGLDMSDALRLGSLPFWASDVLKLTFAGLLIRKFGPQLKALR